jgi:hypothetical protein
VIIVLSGGFLYAQSGWTPIGTEGGFLLSFAVALSGVYFIHCETDRHSALTKCVYLR